MPHRSAWLLLGLAFLVIGGCECRTQVLSVSSTESHQDAVQMLETKISEAEERGCRILGMSSAKSLSVTADCPECDDILDTELTMDVLVKCPVH
jgi:hypothetical protein